MNERGRFQGVIQILQYNRRFYSVSVGALMLAGFAALWLPLWPRILLLLSIAAGFFWTMASLAVSHYVYDRSALYDFGWMRARIGFEPRSMALFHAGLDECNARIQEQFPQASLRVFDIYDGREMTEPSIARARALAGVPADAAITDWRSVPAAAEEFDAVFVIFAAHELRRLEARMEFVRELARVLRKGGMLVLIEHLRDLPNFLAFGPGFLHFFTRREWLLAGTRAGLRRDTEFTITPFVRVFLFAK